MPHPTPISENEVENLGIHLVTTSQDFQTVYNTYRFLKLLTEKLSSEPEIQDYCDIQVKAKILQSDNKYIILALSKNLKTIVTYLKQRQYKYDLYVYLSRDAYFQNWEGITIRVYANYRNFHEQMRIWREIEEIVTNNFESLRKTFPEDYEQIDEVNEMFATAVERLQGLTK